MRLPSTRFSPPGNRIAPTSIGSGITLVATSLGFGVVQLDITIVNTALANIGDSLGGGVATLQWIVNAYTIAFAAFILSAGALAVRDERSTWSGRSQRSSRSACWRGR